MATTQPTCGALVGLWIAVDYDDTWWRGLVKGYLATTGGDNYLECKEEFRFKTVGLDSRDSEVKAGLVEMICAING
jgi:hypothetical protein